MSQIGNNARTIRLRRGESQEAVARRADISTGTLIRIEQGYNEPTIGTLTKIAAALEVPVAELLANDTEPVAG
jgi:transcriptional regulator with XRE-family HTH domain